jgi:hypothetical protein
MSLKTQRAFNSRLDFNCKIKTEPGFDFFVSETRNRLVKSPRVYVRDSGLVPALPGIGNYNQLSGHPVYGPSWAGFVIESPNPISFQLKYVYEKQMHQPYSLSRQT